MFTTKLLALKALNGFVAMLLFGRHLMRAKLVCSVVQQGDVEKINKLERLTAEEVLELALFHVLTTPFGSSSASVRAAIRERAAVPRETWSWLRRKVVDGEVCFGWMTETGTIFSTSEHDSVARTFHDGSLAFAPLGNVTNDQIALYGDDLEFVFRTRAAWHETHYAAFKNNATELRQQLDEHRAAPGTRRPRGKKVVPAGFRAVSHSADDYSCDIICPIEGDIIDAGARPTFVPVDEPSPGKYTGIAIEALLLLGIRPHSRLSRSVQQHPAAEKPAAPPAAKKRSAPSSATRPSVRRRSAVAAEIAAVSPPVSAADFAGDETVMREGGLADTVVPVEPLTVDWPVQTLAVDAPAGEPHVIAAYAANLEHMMSYVPPQSPSSFFYERHVAEDAASDDNKVGLGTAAVDAQEELLERLCLDKSTVDAAYDAGLAIGLTGEMVGWSADTEQLHYFLQALGSDFPFLK
jgi:hypothetical protein